MAKGAQNPSRNPLRFTDIAEDVAECALAAKKKRWRWQRRSVFRRKKPLAVAKPRATCRPCRKKSNCDGRSRKAWKLPNLPDTKSPRRMYQCMTTTSLEYLLTMASSRRSLQSPTVITVRQHPTSLSMTFRTTNNNNNKPSAATLQAASEATRARGRSPFRGNDTRTKTSHSAEPVRRRGGGATADVIEDPVLRAFLEVPDHGKPVRHGSEDRSLSRSRASTRSPVRSRTSRSNSPTPPLKRSVHPQAGGDPRGKQHHPPPHQPSRPVGPPSRGPSLPVYLNQTQGAAPPHHARSTSSSPRRDGKGLRAIPDDTGPSRKVTELDRVKAAQEQQMVLAAIAANLQGGDTQAQSQQTLDKGMREPNPPMSDGAAHIDDEEAALLKALEASRRETARIEERLAQLRRAKRIG